MSFALIVIWYLPVQFYFSQNNYFGWNAKPQSDAELIVDGITLLLVAIATLSSVVIAAYKEKNK